MKNFAEIIIKPPLLHSNGHSKLKELQQLLRQKEQIRVNLSQLDVIDSAGIAVLLDLKQFAQQNNYQVSFTAQSALVTHLCQLYQITL